MGEGGVMYHTRRPKACIEDCVICVNGHRGTAPTVHDLRLQCWSLRSRHQDAARNIRIDRRPKVHVI